MLVHNCPVGGGTAQTREAHRVSAAKNPQRLSRMALAQCAVYAPVWVSAQIIAGPRPNNAFADGVAVIYSVVAALIAIALYQYVGRIGLEDKTRRVKAIAVPIGCLMVQVALGAIALGLASLAP